MYYNSNNTRDHRRKRKLLTVSTKTVTVITRVSEAACSVGLAASVEASHVEAVAVKALFVQAVPVEASSVKARLVVSVPVEA